MLFNSYRYVFVFLPVVFAGYFLFGRLRQPFLANVWLLAASLVFYGFWNVAYLPLLAASIVFNYFIARAVAPDSAAMTGDGIKKKLLLSGVVVNVGLLGYFKYRNFFIESLGSIGIIDLQVFQVIAPIAISFYTIQQIAFLWDSYEGLAQEKDFVRYALFVSFFPYVISGPIVHYTESAAQNKNDGMLQLHFDTIAPALFIFSIGLFKKVIVADSLAPWVDAGFTCQTGPAFIGAWTAALSYTLQIYFDFSGYTDMAIGSALLFNIKLPVNFNSPLRSVGMIEFWQRWHLTLSNFITTYIYTPMVRSLKKITFFKVMILSLLTMLIAGLWHGPSWMFVVFGLLHGIGIVVNHYWRKMKIPLPRPVSWMVTFCYVTITFVFFRAESLRAALVILKGMAGLNGVVVPKMFAPYLQFPALSGISYGMVLNSINVPSYAPIEVLLLLLVVIGAKNSNSLLAEFKPDVKHLLFAVVLFGISFLGMNHVSEFIYFKF